MKSSGFAPSWPAWLKRGGRALASAAGPAAAVLAVLAAVSLSWFRVLEPFELQSYDWRCRLSTASAEGSPILIVDIEDEALKSIGRWPFDRQYHSVLLDALRTAGAASVGFDILFAEPSDSDASLIRSAAKYGRTFFSQGFQSPVTVAGRAESTVAAAPILPEFAEAARGVGHVNIVADPDGKRRRVAPVIWHEGKPHFQLGLLMAMDRLGVRPEDVRFGPGVIDLGGKARIPVDERGETLIRFHGKWAASFDHASYLELLIAYRDQLLGKAPAFDPADKVRGRSCLIGLTAIGTHDINATPVDSLYPQVGVHADFFQNVIDSDFIRRVPRWVNLLALFLLAWAAWGLSRVKRLPIGVGSAVAVWALFVAVNTAVFASVRLWVDLFYPSVLYWILFLSAIVSRTLQEKKKREMLEAELSIASRIQKSFLPAALPEIDGYEMDVFVRPAKHVGGDLYATLRLDGDHMGLMCGDVSGKGMPAALFMARSVAEFKFHAASGTDPAETLRRLNNGLAEGDSSGLFVTMNYAVLDLKARRFVISNGGHMPVLRVRKDGQIEHLSPDGGMPIGLVGDVEFGRLESPADPGDVFVMYSDGISEARNRRGQDFETDRLADAVKRARSGSAAEICRQVVAEVEAFAAGAPQHDDMTLFVFKVRD